MCILSRDRLEFCYLGANKRLRRINEPSKIDPGITISVRCYQEVFIMLKQRT